MLLLDYIRSHGDNKAIINVDYYIRNENVSHGWINALIEIITMRKIEDMNHLIDELLFRFNITLRQFKKIVDMYEINNQDMYRLDLEHIKYLDINEKLDYISIHQNKKIYDDSILYLIQKNETMRKDIFSVINDYYSITYDNIMAEFITNKNISVNTVKLIETKIRKSFILEILNNNGISQTNTAVTQYLFNNYKEYLSLEKLSMNKNITPEMIDYIFKNIRVLDINNTVGYIDGIFLNMNSSQILFFIEKYKNDIDNIDKLGMNPNITFDIFIKIPIKLMTKRFLNNLYNNENCKDLDKIIKYIFNDDRYKDLDDLKNLACSKYIDEKKMRQLVFSHYWNDIVSPELYERGRFDYQTMLYIFNNKKEIDLRSLIKNPNIYPNILMKFDLIKVNDDGSKTYSEDFLENPTIFNNVNIIIINNEKVYLTDEQVKEYTNIKLSLANLPNEISDLILYKYYNGN